MSNVNAQIFQPWGFRIDHVGNDWIEVFVTFGGVDVYGHGHPPGRHEGDAVEITLAEFGHKLRRLLSDAEEDPCE